MKRTSLSLSLSLSLFLPLLAPMLAIGAGCSRNTLPGTGADMIAPPGDAARPSCERTFDRFMLGVQTWDARSWSCDSGKPDFTFPAMMVNTGRVVELRGQNFTIDICHPNADCIPMPITYALDAPGLPWAKDYLPEGAFVKVEFEIARGWGCLQRLRVTAVASWAGEPDPAKAPDGRTYLIAGDGAVEPIASAPLTVEAKRLQCVTSHAGCGGPIPDDYALRFVAKQSMDELTLVAGQTASWQADLGGGARERFTARNLRSYQSDACDDYWNWGWYLYRPITQ